MYFSLEVFASNLTFIQPPNQLGLLHSSNDTGQPDVALAFQFLDYPLLLVYASSPASSTWAGSNRLHVGPDSPASQVTFNSGKVCSIEADGGELKYLVEKIPLYISILDTSVLPRPRLLASGSTPLLISPPAKSPQHAPGAGLPHAVQRSITLFTPSGDPAAVARLSCRLTEHASGFPTFALASSSEGAHTRPVSAPAAQPLPHTGFMLNAASMRVPSGLGASGALPPKPAVLQFHNTPYAPPQPDLLRPATQQGMSQWHHAHTVRGQQTGYTHQAAPPVRTAWGPPDADHVAVPDAAHGVQARGPGVRDSTDEFTMMEAAARGTAGLSEQQHPSSPSQYHHTATQTPREQGRPQTRPVRKKWIIPDSTILPSDLQPMSSHELGHDDTAMGRSIKTKTPVRSPTKSSRTSRSPTKSSYPSMPMLRALLNSSSASIVAKAALAQMALKSPPPPSAPQQWSGKIPALSLGKGLPSQAARKPAGKLSSKPAPKSKMIGVGATAHQAHTAMAGYAMNDTANPGSYQPYSKVGYDKGGMWGPSDAGADPGASLGSSGKIGAVWPDQTKGWAGKTNTAHKAGAAPGAATQPAATLNQHSMRQAMEGGLVGTQMFSQGFPVGPHPAQSGFQMSTVLMWEMMNLVCMRSVLGAAVGAMHNSMTGMANQLVASALQPSMSLLAQQQLSAAGLAALQQQVQAAPGTAGLGVPMFNMPFAAPAMQPTDAAATAAIPSTVPTSAPAQASGQPPPSQQQQPQPQAAVPKPVPVPQPTTAGRTFERSPTIRVLVGDPSGVPQTNSAAGGVRQPPVSDSSASQRPLPTVASVPLPEVVEEEEEIEDEQEQVRRSGRSVDGESIKTEALPDDSYSADFSREVSPRGAQAKAPPVKTGGWVQEGSGARSVASSVHTYEEDFEGGSGGGRRRGGSRSRSASIPEEDNVKDDGSSQKPPKLTLSRMNSATTAMLLASSSDSSSAKSVGVHSEVSDTANQAPPPATYTSPTTATALRSAKSRRTVKGASMSSSSSGSVMSSGSQGSAIRLVTQQGSRHVGFIAPAGHGSRSSSGVTDEGPDFDRQRSLAASEVSFFSSVASSFDDEDEDGHTQESKELDKVRSLHHLAHNNNSHHHHHHGHGHHSHNMRSQASHKSHASHRSQAQSTEISGDISYSESDMSWAPSSDDGMSIDIVEPSAGRNTKLRTDSMHHQPPPVQQRLNHRDSSKSFMVTASDLSSELSIEFDADELASALDDSQGSLQKRMVIGGHYHGRPKTSVSRKKTDSTDLGETAELLDAISNMS